MVFWRAKKNISVSHIANGATRLQPLVMNIGQAAGMAAALCVEIHCQPRELPVRILQEALLQDSRCPSAIIPLFNVTPSHPEWLHWQRYYLLHPEDYPTSGEGATLSGSPQKGKGKGKGKGEEISPLSFPGSRLGTQGGGGGISWGGTETGFVVSFFTGIFHRHGEQDYTIILSDRTWTIVTLQPVVDMQLQIYPDGGASALWGRLNFSGGWLVVEKIADTIVD